MCVLMIAYTYTGAFKLPLNPRMQEVINSETKLLKVWNHGLELNFIQPEKIKRKDKFKGIKLLKLLNELHA